MDEHDAILFSNTFLAYEFSINEYQVDVDPWYIKTCVKQKVNKYVYIYNIM